MVFFVRITVNQSHLRPICKSTKFNPKIQRTIYLINFQQLRLHIPDFIRTVVFLPLKSTAGNSERSSDSCKEGYCNLQNRLPGICFHHNFSVLRLMNIDYLA